MILKLFQSFSGILVVSSLVKMINLISFQILWSTVKKTKIIQFNVTLFNKMKIIDNTISKHIFDNIKCIFSKQNDNIRYLPLIITW